jgi:putative flippase GtrA
MWRFGRANFRAFSPRVVRRFCLVGAISATLYFGIAWLLAAKAGASDVIAANIAFVAVVALNYLLHYHWTFESERAHSVAVVRFCIMNIVGFLLNFAVISIGSRVTPGNRFLVQVVAVGLIVFSNLIINTLWVFGSSPPDPRDRSETR